MVAHNSMGRLAADPSHPSQPVTSDRPCYRCRADAQTDPCDPCPLYFAWLERRGVADAPDLRDRYRAWAVWGGWKLLWTLHGWRVATEREARVAQVLAIFPRVRDRWPDYPRK